MFRRTFLESVAAAGVGGACARSSSDDGSPKCRLVDDTERDELPVATEPDFTARSTKTHRIYWRDQAHFEDKWADGSIAAYAALGGDYIVLNRSYDDLVDTTVVAHEIGHNLGYEHVEGTLMDPYVGQTADSDPDVALSAETVDVFDSMESVLLCEWGTDEAVDHLTAVAEAFAAGETSIGTLGYAARRYASGTAISDAFYRHDWPAFGQNHYGRSLSGQFYR
ncbi:hypothetical protein I7X12_03000 [Halosimplex litoreum]|uniref:Uncharacterized protein n=1 Tax=Halosimplex litoreum TaxID=1198301 RepID=A0A7T3FZN9_9EURY|nr:hypothetical protein [Halosimplex litoreum]QPV63616.1 hypothetical protein I7X12_03000 [Halosimplex litoreum]